MASIAAEILSILPQKNSAHPKSTSIFLTPFSRKKNGGAPQEYFHFLTPFSRKKNGAHVLALKGDLGAGKTSFVKALARELGITEHITSPTFVIMKSYAVSAHAWIDRLVHIDAYRVEDIDEMKVLGIEALYKEAGSIICIEWPERIQALIPEDALVMEIEIKNGEEREIRYGG